MKRTVKKVVFPVGGLGTRFLPATKVMPKEMLPIVDKPIIQYAFEEAKAAGIEQFIFITGRNKSVIDNHFDHAYELQRKLDEKEKKHQLHLVREWLPPAGQVAFVRQQEPKGLGHAIWCARHFVGNDPFAVILADELLLEKKSFLKEMIESYNDTGASVVGVTQVPNKSTSDYGIIVPEGKVQHVMKLKGMVEKPKPSEAPSNFAMIGRYVLDSDIFKYLDKTGTGAGGEIQLTDAMALMLKDKPFHAIQYKERRFDCGGRRGYLEANIAFALEIDELKKDIKAILKKYAE
ncbi:MAG: UTP--glucose-1-phosphate uridylyltransferase [Proteobacteria bacterium]|nr:UTP--glucose-1-phosphate uridylyltransferase [Pseudomonadota bacterium]